jgi:hypothetical protein
LNSSIGPVRANWTRKGSIWSRPTQHLLLVEVSVVVQRCEDRHVARGQAGQQLRQLRACKTTLMRVLMY